jgi:hypothetical protein
MGARVLDRFDFMRRRVWVGDLPVIALGTLEGRSENK